MTNLLSRTKKILLLILGVLSLVTGIIGIFVPLLPTTVFILIAAWCFMRSSDRFHMWLMSHPRFGPMVRNWQEKGAIPRSAKWMATLMISLSIASILLFVSLLAVKVGVIGFLGCVLLFIWTRPEA